VTDLVASSTGRRKPVELGSVALRDDRIAVFETIGCAMAVLRRLDYLQFDADVRETIVRVRSTLSVAQSKVKQRIDQPIQEGTP